MPGLRGADVSVSNFSFSGVALVSFEVSFSVCPLRSLSYALASFTYYFLAISDTCSPFKFEADLQPSSIRKL
jgi:hypothetical protein